jgi:aromatic ring-opening dioxygenase catalytic subunit (LigB family)
MFDTASAPYKAWQAFGQRVTSDAPRGLVVVSAHWEAEGDTVQSKRYPLIPPLRRVR